MSDPKTEPSAATKAPTRLLSLQQLSLNALVREWSGSKSLVGPDGQPLATELMKKVWAALKAAYAQRNPPEGLRCVDMYPFVRTALRIEQIDLSDSGKWINDSSLAALRYVPTLRNVRLTACRFVSDEGLAFVPHLQLHTLDVSWTPVGDSCVASYLVRCPTLTSLNFTGNLALTDRGVASLLPLTGLRRLALCATAISDQSLDYLTYYTRYPDPQRGVQGLDELRWRARARTRRRRHPPPRPCCQLPFLPSLSAIPTISAVCCVRHWCVRHPCASCTSPPPTPRLQMARALEHQPDRRRGGQVGRYHGRGRQPLRQGVTASDVMSVT